MIDTDEKSGRNWLISPFSIFCLLFITVDFLVYLSYREFSYSDFALVQSREVLHSVGKTQEKF